MNTVTAAQVRDHLQNEEYWNERFVDGFFKEFGTEPRTPDQWLEAAQTYLNANA